MPLAEDLGGLLSLGRPNQMHLGCRARQLAKMAGNAPNTLLPAKAKGREAPPRGHFIVIARLNPGSGGLGDDGEGNTTER